ncbi:MAG: winged helix-turn-helix transcriptional regulator [Anaerolineales bacterium]|nr:winged helix-turn-helix transcriptional regulator [Anaerolineales bacterium]
MTTEPLSDRELILLEEIELDPDVTQAGLAAQLGVAVGTVNWHIKRLISKGYVKVKRAQRRKLRYIITPEGLAFRAHLAVNYIETSMRLYRKTRQHLHELLAQVKQAGYNQVIIDGDGDIGEICRLSCLEQGIRVVEADQRRGVDKIPVLQVQGTKVHLHIEG